MSDMDWINDISIWIEANRDVSPRVWEENVWPEIEKRLKEHLTDEMRGMLENVKKQIPQTVDTTKYSYEDSAQDFMLGYVQANLEMEEVIEAALRELEG